MSTLSREQVAQILYQEGARGELLVQLVAIAGRESGYKPAAHRTDRDPSALSGDLGLFQINYKNFPALRNAGIISGPQDLFDPVTNTRAALFLVQQSGGLSPWTAGPGGWRADGDPLYGTNVTAARQAVQNAQNSGMLGQSFQGAGGTAAPFGPQAAGVPTVDRGPVDLPPDAKIVTTAGFSPWGGSSLFALFEVGGVRLAYSLEGVESNYQNFSTESVDQGTWESMGVVMAGDAYELSAVKDTFGTFGDFFQSIMDQVMGPYNPASRDPGVLQVIAEFAARPDMSPVELESKLQRTDWYQKHTQAQLDWNGLSQAEKQARIAEVGNQAAQVWYNLTGQRIDPSDGQISNYVFSIASGQLGWGAFNQIVQKFAAQIDESPYNRETRAEEEAQRQRPIDIENTAANIRQSLNAWGLSWTDNFIMDWATQIVEKRKSDDDLLQAIKQQAAVLYPWKDPEMETVQAAQPWLQTYERVMEQPGSLRTADVQRAITAGQPVWEFEKDLKRSERWLQTKNGQSSMTSLVADLGRKMGFV